MKHQNKIIDYMNENLKGYSFGQLRHAALSCLSYPGADLSAEDFPEIRMPEDVALYLVNNVLHNLPHNDRLKAKATPEYGFTEDEIEVVSDYLLRKMMRLEESGLTDSYCYPRIASFRAKLLRKDRGKI